MQSIYFLIPLSLVLFAFAVWAIRFAVRSGQFDDLDNAAEQIVLEDKQMRRDQLQGNHVNHANHVNHVKQQAQNMDGQKQTRLK